MVSSDKKIYLLVCEGPTDIAVIRALTQKVEETTGKEVEIRELSPRLDKTTGNYPSQGWTEVKSWCESYSINKNITIPDDLDVWKKKLLQKRMSFRWDTLLKSSGANGIILQIDTDIVEEMTHENFSTSGLTRKKFAYNAVNLWLNENDRPDDFYYIMSTFSTETWLLATHEICEDNAHILGDLAAIDNYEVIDNIEARLIALGYSKQMKNGQARLRKEPKIYKKYGEQIASKIDLVKSRCPEADSFYTFLND
ncbi:DUF4276 family protein [Proteus mirabilis]|uniref:hypothetical protein n=1 Tax=Proteus mirabilis TaxID=584 RepID=UPI001A1838F7|nr:hypothetical protein [Proteus mirabilis]ELB1205662.1 hypothetical protein [Proteus mirabilis]MBI6340815.1 hypothetical protein [Proteus mirabilis]MBQ0360029.1 hypothetical protein [Proteus mirabilis]MDC5899007.1 hypothetical protein [Proteus mirabilis]MDC5902487.1 hypothetical protein [Proteus mirabilis]